MHQMKVFGILLAATVAARWLLNRTQGPGQGSIH